MILRTSRPPEDSPSDVCVPSSVLDKPPYRSPFIALYKFTLNLSHFSPSSAFEVSCGTSKSSSEADSFEEIPSSQGTSAEYSCLRIDRGLAKR